MSLRSTHHRSHVRRLAAARLISFAGSEAAYVALVALVLERTHSTIWVAATLFAFIGVAGIVSPVAGALGDHFDRRIVMIVSDAAGAASFVAIALAHRPTTIVALAAVAAVAESPFFPASRAAIPNLVPDTDLAWANATVSLGRTLGSLAGPVAGGLLVASVGAPAAFLVNAASFAISALLVASMGGRFVADRTAAETHAHRGLAAGFVFAARDRVLRTITIAWSIFLLGVGLLLVAEYPLARLFHAGSTGYGLLISAWAAGGLAGAAIARRLLVRRSELAALVIGASTMSITIGLAGLAPWFAIALLAMAAGGVGNSIANVAEDTLVQRRTPDAVRSRVLAATEAVVLIALGGGFAIGGFVVGAAGPRPAYLIAAVAGAGATVAIASLRRAPAPAGVAAGD
jgi:MFS family permease